MNISSLSINRPVLASVLSILLILFGVVGFNMLGLREYPSVDPPIVTVTTTYPGANADIIESQITQPLEESINGIAGIRSLSSTSSDGRSIISVEFNLEADMEAATNDVRDRVSQAIRTLPQDVDPPVVVKSDADADPILVMAIQSQTRDLLQLTDLAINLFRERMRTIPGVSEIRIFGEKKYAMKLYLEPARMAMFQVTPADVRAALLRENVELPSGRIEGYKTELTIRTSGRLTTPNEFDALILKESEGAVVRLSDIGHAVLAPENERSILKGNGGIPQVAIAITPQPGSNHIAISDEFYKRLEIIKKELPADLNLTMSLDTTLNIKKAVREVEETIFIAFGLVVLVIFIFLRQWRSTLIPILAIPISLVSSFAIMQVAGFSINLLTLLGIVLSTGLVVDDAIVVLENIFRKIEEGKKPVQAGHEGAREIFFAIISTTITLAAVFLPIIFISGITGRLFREFAVVVAGSVLVSAFVSLTLTPMMSARLLRHQSSHNRVFSATERWFEWLISRYRGSLNAFMRVRWVALLIMVLTVVIIFGFGWFIPSELAPLEDKSRFRIMVTGPEGTSFEAMEAYNDQIIRIVDTIPEKEVIMAVTGGGGGASAANSGFVRLGLTQPEYRERSQQDIVDQVTRNLKDMNMGRAFAVQEPTIGGGRNSGLPVQVIILAPTFEKLKEALPPFLDTLQNTSAFTVVDVNLKFNKPELRIRIDREKARLAGVSVRDVAENLQLYFSGQRYGYFILDGRQYQVIGQATRNDRDAPDDLTSLLIRNQRGEMVPLANFVYVSNESSPPQLYRYNRYASATISAQPAPGISLGDGIQRMEQLAGSVLPEGFGTALTGTSRDYAESSGSLLNAFFFALILIYLILAAQFESYRDPLIIMFTVPLALAGAVLSLFIFGHSLNIFSQIGMIVLIGIVTKNGILIVEFANQKQKDGLARVPAVVEAATLRLRPILMTSLATMLGALPIALAMGAAAKSRVPMGVTIIGGLLFALVLTLYVIPALYSYVSKNKFRDE